MIKYYDVPQAKIHLVDPINNQLYTWTDNKKLFDNRVEDPDNEMFRFYYWHDTLYCYSQALNKSNEILKIKIPINQIKQESVSVGSFYESSTNWWGILIGILTCVVIVFGYRYWIGRNKKLEIESNNDMKGSTHFTKQEQIILQEMIKKHEEGGVEVNQFNELLEISHKAADNQRKIRNEVVKSLGIKLPTLTNLAENIIRNQIDEDKRSYRYVLTNEAFELLKEKGL